MYPYFKLGEHELSSTLEKPFIALHLGVSIDFINVSLPPNNHYVLDDKLRVYIPEFVANESGYEAIQFTYQLIKTEGRIITLANIIEWILENYARDIEMDVAMAWKEFLKEYLGSEIISKSSLLPILQTEALPAIAGASIALKSILPKRSIKPNNKLANEITRDFINNGEISLIVSKSSAVKEITTKALLSYTSENVNLLGRTKYTPYDREVHDGVVTLCVAGNSLITPEMVYRAMNGMSEAEFVSPQSVGAVTRSLDKHDQTLIEIDFTQEAQAYKKDYSNATYKGRLLSFEKISITAGGQTKTGYKMLRNPILYEYAQVSGQIINVPIALLQTKEAVRSTDEVIVIRGYLLRQIEGMKSPSFNRSNKITFEGIYSQLEVSPATLTKAMYKKKTHTIRQHVEALLIEWQRQEYIKGHTQYKEGRIIKGISIILSTNR
jgi:hypothetical protein